MYVRSYEPVGLTEEEEAQKRLSLEERRVVLSEKTEMERLKLERQRVKAAQKSAFWDGVQAFATAAIPFFAFFGVKKISDMFGGKS